MKIVHLRYVVILGMILFLFVLWEFWLDDLVIPVFSSGAAAEHFGERIEYVVTEYNPFTGGRVSTNRYSDKATADQRHANAKKAHLNSNPTS